MRALRRALPWVLGALAIAMGAVGGILMLRNAARASGLFVPHLFMVPGYALVGAVVASRRPNHPAGWLFLAVAVLAAITTLSFSYAAAVLVTKIATGPAAIYAAWIENWMFPLNFVFFGVVILLFPNGALPSRRWRALLVVLSVFWGLFVLAAMFGPELELGSATFAAPFALAPVVPIAGLVYPIATLPAFGALLACVAAPFFRRRRATPIEREQLRWLAYACGTSVFGALIAASAALAKNGTLTAIFGGLVLFGFAAGIPAAVGAAILRYRLFDIDRIVSRTLSYALVTGVSVGVYVALVVLFGRVLSPLTGSSDLAIAASTLIVAAAFVPVRRRVQSVVDRRFNRARYDAARTIESFSARLRDEVDIDALGAELEDLVVRTMHPAHVSLWVKEGAP